MGDRLAIFYIKLDLLQVPQDNEWDLKDRKNNPHFGLA